MNPVHIAELDDDPDKVYLFGLNLQDPEQADEMQKAIDAVFHNAGVFLLNLPVDEGSNVEIHEADKEDLQELIDYRDITGDL